MHDNTYRGNAGMRPEKSTAITDRCIEIKVTMMENYIGIVKIHDYAKRRRRGVKRVIPMESW
jgi:hypothetical protein